MGACLRAQSGDGRDQLLQPTRRQAQDSGVSGLQVPLGKFHQLRLEDVVDFLFDRIEIGFAACLTYAARQVMQGSAGLAGSPIPKNFQIPASSEAMAPSAIVERVAVFVEEVLLRAF